GYAKREVVKAQLGEGFAGAKAEVLNDVSAILDGPSGLTRLGMSAGGDRYQKDECEAGDHCFLLETTELPGTRSNRRRPAWLGTTVTQRRAVDKSNTTT